MRNILLIALTLISTLLIGQTKVTVNIANFSFTPNSLSINVGDTIEFVNTSGTHWVDGRQATFPSNPVSFDNQSQSGSGWTYTQVFNTAGTYDYRCGIHTASMSGVITVQTPAGVDEPNNVNLLDFYPNPASKELNFSNYNSIEKVTIYSINGKKVESKDLINKRLDISNLATGTYFVKIQSDNVEVTKKLVIQ